MEHFVYAIKSDKDKRIYVGISKNPEKRLSEHNKGETKSTKSFRPWKIIYMEKYENRVLARR